MVTEMSEIEKLAMQWIYDLRDEYRHLRKCKKELESRPDDWQYYMRVVIKSEKYSRNYKYVSQLCYTIGGTVLNKFKELAENRQKTM